MFNPGITLPEIFSSPLYMHEFSFGPLSYAGIFSCTHALAGYFFSKAPNPPPPSKVKWLAP